MGVGASTGEPDWLTPLSESEEPDKTKTYNKLLSNFEGGKLSVKVDLGNYRLPCLLDFQRVRHRVQGELWRLERLPCLKHNQLLEEAAPLQFRGVCLRPFVAKQAAACWRARMSQ